ncbi:hypothetical protein OV090_10690 [Nannocystis sp. RBIL2]|uniref:hypothetical protein n=1 Tax=Nannocystis sp. RBIL2 TaxID=2996788 RepID=UPI0022702CC8|nr:hypothetical protein [Nannocystis sp. RBIL2]MCY1065230.1 hypothetical protein [Nannocystis sp. RBIL2]
MIIPLTAIGAAPRRGHTACDNFTLSSGDAFERNIDSRITGQSPHPRIVAAISLTWRAQQARRDAVIGDHRGMTGEFAPDASATRALEFGDSAHARLGPSCLLRVETSIESVTSG